MDRTEGLTIANPEATPIQPSIIENAATRSTCSAARRGKRCLRSFLMVCDVRPRHFGAMMRFLVELGRKAASEGIRMGVLLAAEPIPVIADAFRTAGIDWWSLPKWKTEDDVERTWEFIAGFSRISALENWDVVSFNYCRPVSVVLACTWSRIRHGRRFARVWHQHQGVPSPRGIKKYVSTLRLLGRFMNALVATSKVGTKYYRERHCPEDKIRVIYWGLRLPENPSLGCLRPKLGLPESANLLVTVASLIHRKGLDVLLEAVSDLFKKYPNWNLLVVGAGPLLENLQELAQSLNIDQQTRFLGMSHDVNGILAECDAFVLPSRNEDLPSAILEAMSLSLPVVATDVGSVSDLVVPHKTGLLVPPDEPVALRSALEAVITDSKAACEFGRNGGERVARLFTLDGMVEGHLNLFRELCITS